jgi:hypothetical protein
VHRSRNRAYRPATVRGSATFNPAGAMLFDEQIAQISSATAIDTLITEGENNDGYRRLAVCQIMLLLQRRTGEHIVRPCTL